MKALFPVLLFALLTSVGFAQQQQQRQAKSVAWSVANAESLKMLDPVLLKKPVPVLNFRSPLPVQGKKTDGASTPPPQQRADVGSKLRANLTPRIRSVIRGTRPLIAIDDRLFEPGDEIVLGSAGKVESPVPNARVILKRVDAETLTFAITNTADEANAPWATEIVVPIVPFLR